VANQSGNAYALTLLCPILQDSPAQPVEEMTGQSHADLLRYELQQLRVSDESPMARVPNTYLSRLFVLNDVPYQGHPAVLEHLKSSYLVFESNFHGGLDDYLRGMWNAVEQEIRAILSHCVGFDRVSDLETFVAYIKKCQITTTFFFNGSSDEPLETQLKSLYLKQEFSQFAFENQGRSAADLQAAFLRFIERTAPAKARPTWKPGAYHLKEAVLE
jgi:hypothetical protein